MNLTKLSIFSLFLSAMAAPTLQPGAPISLALQITTYTIIALRSGSPVHFLPLNAWAGSFQLGGRTSSYCPASESSCPPGNITVFNSFCTLDSQHPEHWNLRRQTLWGASNGEVGYDFSQVRPAATRNCPWYLGPSQNTAFVGTIEASYGGTGFLACPTVEEGVWRVLRSAPDTSALAPPLGNVSACLGVDLAAVPYNSTEYGAWVYS